MNTRRFQVLVFAAALVLLGPAKNGIARTWLVSKEATPPLTTIQRALELAQNGDSILVAPGTYNEDIDFLGKDVVLKSESGPEVTILDGAGQDSSIVMFRSREPQGATLDGFTLQNGAGSPIGSGTKGGAILCSTGSPHIVNNIFSRNHARFGGAIWVGPSISEGLSVRPAPVCNNNRFFGNVADFPGNGGGINISGYVGAVSVGDNHFVGNSAGSDGGAIEIYISSGSVVVEKCTFSSNTAQDQGGAIFVFADPVARLPVTISHCLINSNSAGNRSGGPGSGGAITFSYAEGLIDHNTIVDNRGAPESPCGGGGVRLLHTSSVVVEYNIIANNMQCGLICRDGAIAQIRANLLWHNQPEDAPAGSGECPAALLGALVIQDPQFCTSSASPYQLASTSPGLSLPGAPFGALGEPGCVGTPVKFVTWSSVKAMFR